MKSIFKSIFYLSICLSFNHSFAQINDLKEVSAFTFSVKSIDQFIDRFNYDKRDAFRKAYEQSVDVNDGSERKKALLTLFDFQRIEADTYSYNGLVEKFISAVENNDSATYLDFYDKQWYVKLKMDIQYKGADHQLEATLYNYSPSQHKSSWTIAAIHCESLNWHYSTSKPNILLPPNSEGTDFINFRHLIKAESQFVDERKKDTSLEPFFAEVVKGNLGFSYVRDIEYIFLQIPKFIVVVKEFRRKEENSGWLIDHLILADNAFKSNFKASELGINK